jgi:hypothetical protein
VVVAQLTHQQVLLLGQADQIQFLVMRQMQSLLLVVAVVVL